MDRDKDTLIKNAFMFIYARENKPALEKIANLDKTLTSGAYINFPDANNKNNTILHVATELDEKDVVEYLLKKGALLLYNLENKTPLHIAKEKNSNKDLINILTEYEKHSPCANAPSSASTNQNRLTTQKSCPNNVVEISYLKRAGTSGVSGQFYETKLLSLVLHRALHDKIIQECYLAANIRDIGDFDDVCFRFQMQEDDKIKHFVCFTQAKHREDPDKAKLTVESVRHTSGQFCLIKYFDSFLKIKQKFLTKSKVYDPMFAGEFNDIDCYFILYTNVKEDFKRKLTDNKPICRKMHEFIYTGEEEHVFQFDHEISDINFLSNYMQQERVKALGKVFLTFVFSNNTKNIMADELIQIYHPALAKHVIKLEKSDSNCYEGKFREEFFDTDDDLLNTLKYTLFYEVVFKSTKKTKLSKEQVKQKIKDIVNNPCPQTISTLIGEVLIFEDKINKLRLDGDKISLKQYQGEIHKINLDLHQVQVTQALVNDAIKIKGTEKLKLLTFKLPHTFGNLDFPSNLKGNQLQMPTERLEFLANKFYELIKEKKRSLEEKVIQNQIQEIIYPVEISICEENVGKGKTLNLSHLDNKGIGGTVGNLLQFDPQSQTFTFNTDEASLGENSKYMLKEIIKLTQETDLTKYKINVKMNNFPQTSFDANDTDKKQAKEFLSKLWFYTNQANEETVESKLKTEIEKHYNAIKSENQFLFRVHSDAIFLRFHDEIQKWWKSQSQARYLTKTDVIFDEAKKDIIDSPVLTVLNVMFMRTLKKLDIEFHIDKINSMNVEKIMGSKKILNIVSDAVILTAIKLMQLVSFHTNYTFVNLDYIQILPENDYNKLMDELMEKKALTLIIICETSFDEQRQNTLSKIMEIYNEKLIIVTDKPLPQNNNYVTFNDKNINLNDLHTKSQDKVLKEFKVCYQGKDVPLSTILIDHNTKSLINAKMLWSILNKTKIEVGHSLDSPKYNEIKNYYVVRNLIRGDNEIKVNTLNDIDDKIVLITSKPCMGKSILLTHLSLETKNVDPQPWIVHINPSGPNKIFDEWPEKDIHVTNIMRFLCKAALKTTDTNKNLEFSKGKNNTVIFNKKKSEDISFELALFVHFYNQGKVIILFDGFEKIYPRYTKEGIELLNELKQANKRVWITSNCYITDMLERELNTESYTLEKLSTIQQESFLSRFWRTNLKLEKLNHQQFENISVFFNYLMKLFKSEDNEFTRQQRPFMPLFSIPLHIIYLTLIEHFKHEINSLSPRYLREKLQKKWKLNSYTVVDRFLRPDEEESLELAGTPIHMYIASNYFKLQITDKFDLQINKDTIIERSNAYLNAFTSYERFLKSNVKHICEIEDKTNKKTEQEQEKVRDAFFATHKKLALYAICKESDVSKILTPSEIREVKQIIKRIESGEMKTDLIDCVIDGVPKFYNLMFAEYFVVELATDMIKRVLNDNTENMTWESLWNFIVNVIFVLCPHGVRKCFDFKLKYDPELAEVASNDKVDKILFEIILKQNKKAELAGRDKETALNIAINDGLVNITNLMLKSARRFVKRDNVDGFLSILKSGAFILGAANPSWKDLTDVAMHCIHNVDGNKLIETINSNQLAGVSETVNMLCSQTKFGKELHEKIKKEVCRPVQKLTHHILEVSRDDENLTNLLDVLPHHLPDIVNSVFNGITWEDKDDEAKAKKDD